MSDLSGSAGDTASWMLDPETAAVVATISKLWAAHPEALRRLASDRELQAQFLAADRARFQSLLPLVADDQGEAAAG